MESSRRLSTADIVILATIVASLDNQAVPPLLATLGRHFQVNVGTSGILLSVNTLASALIAPLLAPLAARRGTIRILRAGLALLLGGFLLSVVAPGFGYLAAGRFLSGLGSGAVLTMAHGYLVQNSETKDRGRMLGRLLAALYLGGIIGIPLFAAVADHLNWRLVFGLLALFAGGSFLALAGVIDSLPRTEFRYRDFGPLLKRRGIAAGLAMSFLFASGFMSAIAYVGAWLEESHGFSTTQVGLVFLVASLGGMTGGLLMGQILSGWSRRRTAIAGNTGMAACFVLMPLAPGALPAAALFALSNLLASIRYSAAMALFSDQVPQAERPQLMLLNHFSLLLGMAAASWGCGLVYSRMGFPAVAVIAGLLTVAAAGAVMILPPVTAQKGNG